MGEIGLQHDFVMYDITFTQVHQLIRGYRRRTRTSWEQTRWLIWSIGSMMGGKIESPEDLCTFPWEYDSQKKEEDMEALNRLLEEARSWNAQHLI